MDDDKTFDAHHALHQSLNDCAWKSVMFFANNILEKNKNDYEAIFAKSFVYFVTKKYLELERFISTLPEQMMKDENLLDLRCRGLAATKQYQQIISLLGGEFESIPLTQPLVSLGDVIKCPALSKHRELALFNLSQIDYKPKEKGQPIVKSMDPLSPHNIIALITKAMNTNNPQLLEKFTTLSDSTTDSDPLILTACACYCILRGDPLNQVPAILLKATEVDPDCEIAWLAMIISNILLSEFDQGLATLRNVDHRFPNSANVPAFAASLHLKSGSSSLAWPWLNRACDISPDSPYLMHEKGAAYLMDGNYSSAAKLFKSVLKMTDEEGLVISTYINLGHCLRRMKNFDDAIESYQAAISHQNNSTNALSSIGFTYHLKKDFDNAILFYNQCLSIDPVNPFATKMLDIAIQSLSK